MSLIRLIAITFGTPTHIPVSIDRFYCPDGVIIKQRSGSAWPGLRVQGGIVGIECGKLCGGGLHVPIQSFPCSSVSAFAGRLALSSLPSVRAKRYRRANEATHPASWSRQAIAVFNAEWASLAISDVYLELGKSHPVEWLTQKLLTLMPPVLLSVGACLG